MFNIFSSPARYTQGMNATRILGREMAGLSIEGPALIVAGRSALAQLFDTWKQTLGEVGCGYSIHGFGGECSLAEIARIRHGAEALAARVIIGAGGGKALDAARATSAELGLPFVSCPTLASTDAPCSAVSVIYTESGIVEEIRNLPYNPVLVLVDTQVIAQAPPRFLASGMGDALATWFEARACAASHSKNLRGGSSTRSALALAELCYRTLLEDGVEAIEARRTRGQSRRPSSVSWRPIRCFQDLVLSLPVSRQPTPFTTASRLPRKPAPFTMAKKSLSAHWCNWYSKTAQYLKSKR